MTDKVDLPDGGWAVLRDPEDVTEKLRRPLQRLNERVMASGVGEYFVQRKAAGDDVSEEELRNLLKPVIGTEDWGQLDESADYLIVALVKEWSFETPVTVESVTDLPGRTYKALKAVCEPLAGKVLGTAADDDVTDPASPTQPGSD